MDSRSNPLVDVQDRTAGALPSDSPYSTRVDYGPRQSRVQEIDFRRPTKFARELVRRLEHAHESFCRTASSALSAELRTSFELWVAGSEQLPYGTAMAEAQPDALLAVLHVAPLDTEVAMVILRRAVASLVEPLSATWLDLADVHFSTASIQTSPMTFQLVPPSEPVLMMHLETRIDGLISPLVLCIPYRSVEPIVGKLEHRHYDGHETVDPAAAGKVIRLRRRADKGVIVYAGDVPTYVAQPGRNGNRRALKITGPWERGR